MSGALTRLKELAGAKAAKEAKFQSDLAKLEAERAACRHLMDAIDSFQSRVDPFACFAERHCDDGRLPPMVSPLLGPKEVAEDLIRIAKAVQGFPGEEFSPEAYLPFDDPGAKAASLLFRTAMEPRARRKVERVVQEVEIQFPRTLTEEQIGSGLDFNSEEGVWFYLLKLLMGLEDEYGEEYWIQREEDLRSHATRSWTPDPFALAPPVVSDQEQVGEPEKETKPIRRKRRRSKTAPSGWIFLSDAVEKFGQSKSNLQRWVRHGLEEPSEWRKDEDINQVLVKLGPLEAMLRGRERQPS